MHKRVGIAQAFIGDPPLLILDEPTAGLDPQQIVAIRELIRELGRRHTLLLSTHILPEVEANLLAIPRKQRAMVRKGIKAELRSEIDESVDRFFELYADNVHRHGTPPFPKRYFQELKRVFGDACECLIVVDKNGTPVSGVMSFYLKDEVLPYYAGDLTAARAALTEARSLEVPQRLFRRGRESDFHRRFIVGVDARGDSQVVEPEQHTRR